MSLETWLDPLRKNLGRQLIFCQLLPKYERTMVLKGEAQVNSEQTKTFQAFVEESLKQALPDFEFVRVEDPENSDPIQWLDPIHVSIMRFHGDGMQGNSILGCDISFLEKTCPHFDRSAPDHLRSLQDWIGELSNLVLGRLKNKLLPFGTVLKLNPPSVTAATSKIFDLYANYSDTFKLWYLAGKDYICLAFSLDVAASVDLHVTTHGDESQLQPGDAIYRLNDIKSDLKSYDMVSNVRSNQDGDRNSNFYNGFEFAEDVFQPERFHSERADDRAPAWAQGVSNVKPALVAPASASLIVDVQLSKLMARDVGPSVKAPSKGENPSRGSASLDDRAKMGWSSAENGQRRTLEGLQCLRSGEIYLRFAGNITYTLAPQRLLETGRTQISIEGYQVILSLSERGVRMELPELLLTLEQVAAAA